MTRLTMKQVHVLITILLVAVASATALAQGQSGAHAGAGASAGAHAGKSGAATNASLHAEADFNNLSAAAKANGLAHAEKAKLFAQWRYDNASGIATGRFVNLVVDGSNGGITHFALNANNTTIPLLASVTLSPPVAVTDGPRATGAMLRFAGDNASFSAHNNPVGLWSYRFDIATTVTVTASAGATFANDTNRSVRLNGGGIHAHLILGGDGSFTHDNATATFQVPANGTLTFLGHPGDLGGVAAGAASLHQLRDAIGAGRLGGAVSIVNENGSAVEDRTFLGVDAHASSLGNDSAHVTVASDDADGKAVVLDLDASVVNASSLDKITIQLDGQTLPRAATETDVYQATGSGGSVFVNKTATGIVVIVNVPHFSGHDISIASTDTSTAPTSSTTATQPSTGGTTDTSSTPAGGSSKAPGFELVLLAAAAGATALALRRR